MNRVALNAALK